MLLILVAVQSRRIHGKFRLSQDCFLEIVDSDATFLEEDGVSPTRISSNYDLVKILVALGQAVYASTTLYQTRGDQIDQYGYAAFGLTVTPYAFMSVVNLLGNLARPSYPAMYIIQPTNMDEILIDGTQVEGFIGKVNEYVETSAKTNDLF
jgi:hypothetical protein